METVKKLLSKKKRCGNCRWFLQERKHFQAPTMAVEKDHVWIAVGECHCRCPISGKFPKVDETEFCGDFEKHAEIDERQTSLLEDDPKTFDNF
jgi:hypothetical protein